MASWHQSALNFQPNGPENAPMLITLTDKPRQLLKMLQLNLLHLYSCRLPACAKPVNCQWDRHADYKF